MKILTIILGLLCLNVTFGQDEDDIIRWSVLNRQGSARSMAVGNAMGALGADMSVGSINPAGFARYMNSEFSFTPVYEFNLAEATLGGTSTMDIKQRLGIGNLGLTTVSKAAPDSPYLWKSVQLGLTYNKLASFNEQYRIKGYNRNSLSFALARMGKGIPPNYLDTLSVNPTYLAYQAYLTDYDSAQNGYVSVMQGDNFEHDHSFSSTGSLGETNINVAANYNNKIYLGGSIGFVRGKYYSKKNHSEIVPESPSEQLLSFDYSELFQTNINGINAKGGLIVLPQPWLRIGLAAHSPTKIYYAKDNYQYAVHTYFLNKTEYRQEVNGSFLYTMRIPGRLIGSLGLIILKKGFVSVDVEKINYARGLLSPHKYSGDSYAFTNENKTIQEDLNKVYNLRVGGELKLTQNWMIRLGYAYNPDVFPQVITDQTSAMSVISGGIGLRTNNVFIDLSVSSTNKVNDYYLYDKTLIENTPLSRTNIYSAISIGFKW